MRRIKVNNFFCLLFLLSFISCDQNKEYDVYETIENSSWKLDQPITFDVDINEIEQPKNVFLQVRTDKDYFFRNLFIISKMTLPNGTVLKDTLEYEMADPYGNLLGSGITDVKDSKLYYLEKYKFPIIGNYQFEFSHAMRKRGDLNGVYDLTGVTDLGLRIEKIQE